MRRRNLLVELGTEELPPQALKKLARAFADNFFQGLVDSGVADSSSSYRFFSTPRRLAVWVGKVNPRQADPYRGTARSSAEGGIR